ncbi:hypothetical protein [Methanococcoides alaskense]|uniref:Dolichol kinase n=1 Tax=Methanococcoides alaskense TaxID=325778 RepID=A0AA90TZB8_9EURY|nr:hypothetical protein [Methanococcoides alaskense]MDA0524823.1 hypothetical protein [Methanococcoides alaskense]MDR6223053.1 dolichol kinase [Methanococcoides alaskense]
MSEYFACSVQKVRSYLPIRKAVHISGSLFPLTAIYFGKNVAMGTVSALLILFLVAEFVKPVLKEYSFFSYLWRENESNRFALAPFLYLISILALLLLSSRLNEGICYASIIVLTMGDGLSTIFGVHGKMCYGSSSKTVEGTLAGLIGAIIFSYPFVGYLSIVGGLVGMYLELRSKKLDNITVPFSALLAMLIVHVLVNVYI